MTDNTGPMDEQVAWLVEYPEQGRYLSLNDSVNPPYWLTQDPNTAMRFSRKIDAEAIIRRHELAGVAVEHKWVAMSASVIDEGLWEAVSKIAARYEDQAKFADIDYAVHFRDFAQQIRTALANQRSGSNG